MTITGYRRSAAASRQHGVAAIEFALVFVVLFMFLYGIATFGAVLYTKQVVARAAADGARAVSYLSALTDDDPRIQGAVYDSLANALIVPIGQGGNTQDRRSWIAANVTVKNTGGNAALQATVTVTYPYSANRLLPLLPLFDTSWVPKNLTGRATATRSTEGAPA